MPQFGVTRQKLSHRSRQDWPTRPRSRTTCSIPRSASSWLVANPACPPPTTITSMCSMRASIAETGSPTTVRSSSRGSARRRGASASTYPTVRRHERRSSARIAPGSAPSSIDGPSCRHVTDRGHLDALSDLTRRRGRVPLEVADDLVAREIAVGIVAVVRSARELHAPVRRHQAEAVPSVSPRLTDPSALEHHVLDPSLSELVTRRQPGLATAHHDDIDAFHIGSIADDPGRDSDRRAADRRDPQPLRVDVPDRAAPRPPELRDDRAG